MEEYKFSDSNLDFYELLDKYKTLNTTYSDIDDFKINIYENYNLLQDDLITAFTVPSTNIRLSSFKNNYIIADTQTLDLDRAFYTANPTLFSTVEGETEGETYINNIDLTNIITTYFNYANDDIYPSKKIIITINLLNEIVDTDGSGALQIDMKEIKEHFHSVFDTLELDINQYVTGKHGTLEDTNLEPDRFQAIKGGSGQNADVHSAGPAINITNNNPPYFKLNIKTNGNVSGGFGASGGRGGDGYKNETAFAYDWENSSTSHYDYLWDGFTPDRLIRVARIIESANGLAVWKAVTTYYWNGVAIFTDTTTPRPYILGMITNLGVPIEYPDSQSATTRIPGTNTYKYTKVYYDTEDTAEFTSASESYWSIRQNNETYVQTGELAPKSGSAGSTATYSNNAVTVFDTQAGSTGTPNDGAGGTGGTKGNPGGITNITAANITIEP